MSVHPIDRQMICRLLSFACIGARFAPMRFVEGSGIAWSA